MSKEIGEEIMDNYFELKKERAKRKGKYRNLDRFESGEW